MPTKELSEKLRDRELAKTNKTPTLFDLVRKQQSQFELALSKTMSSDKFTRIALTMIKTNPKLLQCSTESVLGGLMQAAQLSLEPGMLGQCWLIPYGKAAQFQIGYKGLLRLFYNSYNSQIAYAREVYENDYFEYSYGLDPVLEHKPAQLNRGRITHYYAVAKLTNGGFGFEVMTIEEIHEHKEKYSKSWQSKSSAWQTDFDSMARKTVLLKVLKMMPLSTEVMSGISSDEKAFNVDEALAEDGILNVEATTYEEE